MCKPKVPKTKTPAAAPPPSEESAADVQTEAERQTDDENKVKRRGRAALRIDLNSRSLGSGLSIPTY